MAEPTTISEFVTAMAGHTVPEVQTAALQAVAHCEPRALRLRTRDPQGSTQAAEFGRDLKGLLFFIGNGIKPGGMPEEAFRAIRPLFVRWVKAGEFKATVLDAWK